MIEKIYKDMILSSPNNTHKPNHASIYLCKFADIKNNMNVCEIGSGIGHVSICLDKLYNIKMTGIEVQNELYDYSIINNSNNNSNVDFINLDIKYVKEMFESDSFDYVVSNPPHYFENTGKISPTEDRKKARTFTKKDLNNFLYATNYLLKNKKMAFYIIHPSIFIDFINLSEKNKLTPQKIIPFYGSFKKECQLLGVYLRKNGGKNLVFNNPILL